MILLSIYIYNWIGNKFLQLTSPSPYEYINNINKTNQMTANVQAISIIISKFSKIIILSNKNMHIKWKLFYTFVVNTRQGHLFVW